MTEKGLTNHRRKAQEVQRCREGKQSTEKGKIKSQMLVRDVKHWMKSGICDFGGSGFF